MKIYTPLANLIEQHNHELALQIWQNLKSKKIQLCNKAVPERFQQNILERLEIVQTCLSSSNILIIQNSTQDDTTALLQKGYGVEIYLVCLEEFYAPLEKLVKQEFDDPHVINRYLMRLQRIKLLSETVATSIRLKKLNQSLYPKVEFSSTKGELKQ